MLSIKENVEEMVTRFDYERRMFIGRDTEKIARKELRVLLTLFKTRRKD